LPGGAVRKAGEKKQVNNNRRVVHEGCVYVNTAVELNYGREKREQNPAYEKKEVSGPSNSSTSAQAETAKRAFLIREERNPRRSKKNRSGKPVCPKVVERSGAEIQP